MANGMAAGITIIIVSLLIGIGGIVFILNWLKSHRFRVRDPLNKKAYLEDYWMLEKVDRKTGIVTWKTVFWQKKMEVPEPPKDAVDVGKKGRKYVEAYRLTEDEYIWITDKGIQIKEINGKVEAYDMDDNGVRNKIDSFKPFSVTQRQVLINQYIKADEIAKKRWSTGEVLGAISMGGLVLVIICILIFGGDLLKEYRDTRTGTTEVLKATEQITRNQALLMQSLGIKVEQLEVVLATTPTNQQSNLEEPPDSFDIRSTVGLD